MNIEAMMREELQKIIREQLGEIDCKSVNRGSIPLLASTVQPTELVGKNDSEAHAQELSTDFRGEQMKVSAALKKYKLRHLDGLTTGAERYKQLRRLLEKYSRREMHKLTNRDLTAALNQWSGGTRNRYRSAVTHFWKWAASEGLTTLNPVLMPGKENPRDRYLSLGQLRELYAAADLRGDWAGYGRLLILTGQRNSDVMRINPTIILGDELHLPTSKNGTSHIVHLNHRAQAVIASGLPFLGKKNQADFKRRWFIDAGIPLEYQLRDIRRSFATHMVENGADENVVDRILNHQAAATSAGVKRTYNRAMRLKERRQVMFDWENLLLGSHKVVQTDDVWRGTHAAPMTVNFGYTE